MPLQEKTLQKGTERDGDQPLLGVQSGRSSGLAVQDGMMLHGLRDRARDCMAKR